MKALSKEELLELRKEFATLSIPQERQEDLIHLIDALVISFIDQAFGLDPVQLSLSARANRAFASPGERSAAKQISEFEELDDNLKTPKGPEGHLKP